MRDVEIIWDDLLDAFQNSDPDTLYFLDRESGEIFSVPIDYEDDDLWEELEQNDDRYLKVPDFDYEQERFLLTEFTKSVRNDSLKKLLERSLSGKHPYGRLDEVLSFYPEERERLVALKEELVAERVRQWLEMNDIFVSDQ
jgi:hypothetical protein